MIGDQPSIIPFDFDGAAVRVIMRDGSPWFVLADVCRVLGVGNPSDAAKRLDEDEKETLDNIESAKINGLYQPALTMAHV